MNRHTIEDYLEIDSLTPSRSEMGEISDTDWWTATADHFDELLWLYYPDRTVYLNRRFPYDPNDPDNSVNTAKVIENIRRSFSIFLKANDYKYSHLYNTIMLKYEPLWNVDGTEEEDRRLDRTGTVTDTKSGSDTTEYAGTETNTRSGSVDNEKLGSEAVTRSGNEVTAYDGSEASTRSGSVDKSYDGGSNETTTAKTTFDSSTMYDTEKVTETPGATETETYNDVADTKSFTDREDTRTYNDVKDEQTFDDRNDKVTYNDVTDEKSFDKRTDEITYDNELERENDLHDRESIIRRRTGNIGVTSSQNLLLQERNAARYEFFKEVVHDCINLVSYAVEGIS